MSVKTWISDLLKLAEPAVVVIVGNKCDLAEKRGVDRAGSCHFFTVLIQPLIAVVSALVVLTRLKALDMQQFIRVCALLIYTVLHTYIHSCSSNLVDLVSVVHFKA